MERLKRKEEKIYLHLRCLDVSPSVSSSEVESSFRVSYGKTLRENVDGRGGGRVMGQVCGCLD